jgi:hypothetical protein
MTDALEGFSRKFKSSIMHKPPVRHGRGSGGRTARVVVA